VSDGGTPLLRDLLTTTTSFPSSTQGWFFPRTIRSCCLQGKNTLWPQHTAREEPSESQTTYVQCCRPLFVVKVGLPQRERKGACRFRSKMMKLASRSLVLRARSSTCEAMSYKDVITVSQDCHESVCSADVKTTLSTVRVSVPRQPRSGPWLWATPSAVTTRGSVVACSDNFLHAWATVACPFLSLAVALVRVFVRPERRFERTIFMKSEDSVVAGSSSPFHGVRRALLCAILHTVVSLAIPSRHRQMDGGPLLSILVRRRSLAGWRCDSVLARDGLLRSCCRNV
jgi:hypothetical protein